MESLEACIHFDFEFLKNEVLTVSKPQFDLPRTILETEGSVQKIQKRALFHYKKVKKGTPNLTSPFIHSLLTIVLIKKFFEKNKSSRAASESRTQF